MNSLMGMAKDLIHDRVIETKTYFVDEEHLLCTGTLRETRHLDYYKFTGERVEAGLLHGLTILLLVKVPSMVIEEIEVSMDTVPRFECREIEDCLAPVKGMAITGGFSSKIRAIAGGEKGCTHLLHLIITMAPAVMQGYWASRYRKKPDLGYNASGSSSKMGAGLMNTCYVWREHGPAFTKLKKLIEEKSGTVK